MQMKMSKLEESAVKLLLKYEDKGILQSELWHRLGVTSREGSRIAIKLEKKGIVKRVKEVANDRWTRRLIPLIRQVSIDPIEDAPCPSCAHINVCSVERSTSPYTCVALESWLLSELQAQADGKEV